jgi:two-component system NtrC family sensor kinase
VVDDSPTYQEYIAMELQRAGYQVDTAASVREALEQLALQTYDGVVLDMILPDMNGAEMCRHFVAANRTMDHRFVLLMLTGGEDPDEMNSVLAAGADDVVGKSKDIKIVKARLYALIRRKLMYEENQNIINEFKEKEIALLRIRAEKEAAEERAALADQLAQTNKELKETQSQLVQSAKMASLGELVAGVAHEINNPLAFVISHLSTIKDGISGVLPEIEPRLPDKSRSKMNKLQQRIQDMQSGLERIKDLVIKLRTFSRLDEGEFKQVNIQECIESVLTLLQYRLKDRITIVRRYGDDNIIDCYPGPLNQVIMNVISNAIDAVEGQGVITITTSKTDSNYTISIADTGKGIPDDIRDRVFEPFFTTKPVGEGTGLGLSISYGIVKKHGGEISIESETGKGTKMSITIPWKQ